MSRRVGIEVIGDMEDVTFVLSRTDNASMPLAEGTTTATTTSGPASNSMQDSPRILAELIPNQTYYLVTYAPVESGGPMEDPHIEVLFDAPEGYRILVDNVPRSHIREGMHVENLSGLVHQPPSGDHYFKNWMFRMVPERETNLLFGERTNPYAGDRTLLDISLGQVEGGAHVGWIKLRKTPFLEGVVDFSMVEIARDESTVHVATLGNGDRQITTPLGNVVYLRQLTSDSIELEFIVSTTESITYTVEQGSSINELVVTQDGGQREGQIVYELDPQTFNVSQSTTQTVPPGVFWLGSVSGQSPANLNVVSAQPSSAGALVTLKATPNGTFNINEEYSSTDNPPFEFEFPESQDPNFQSHLEPYGDPYQYIRAVVEINQVTYEVDGKSHTRALGDAVELPADGNLEGTMLAQGSVVWYHIAYSTPIFSHNFNFETDFTVSNFSHEESWVITEADLRRTEVYAEFDSNGQTDGVHWSLRRHIEVFGNDGSQWKKNEERERLYGNLDYDHPGWEELINRDFSRVLLYSRKGELVTRYHYYADPNYPETFGKIGVVEQPYGNWRYHEYYQGSNALDMRKKGLPKAIHTPVNNTALGNPTQVPTGTTSNPVMTREFDYSDSGDGAYFMRRVSEEKT
ncbi:MAG: hypothetical protein JJU20_14720, partial [Opitutales bacterium]|nr:hypothetical protein [Opitutales bacterium]